MVEVMKKVSVNYVENAEIAKKMFPGALVLDVTRGGGMEKLDPAYPIEKVRIPGIKRMRSLSIGGVFEGLKIFKKKGEIDESWFLSEKKLGKMRKCKSYGECIGIKIGDEIKSVEEGVKEIFVDLYKEVIGERFEMIIEGLREVSESRDVILLDYEESVYPVSHAEILKEMILDK